MNGQPKKDIFTAEVFHPGLGDQPVPGRIRITQFTLRFESDQVDLEIPLDNLVLRLKENKDMDRLTLRDNRDLNWAICTDDLDILDHRTLSANTRFRRQVDAIHGRQIWWKALGITTAFFAIMLAGGLLISWGAHWMVLFAVAHVSPSMEKSIGDKYYRESLKYMPVSQDPALINRLNSIFDQLRPGLPDPNISIQFHIIETEVPNAASLPGHIFVTRGMFGILDTPDELAGVLGHEAGHITHRHVIRLMISNQGPAKVLKAVFHDASGTVGTIAQTSQFIIGRSFSRDCEREADEAGWNYLIAANINPRGLIDALVKLRNEEDHTNPKVDFLATHPDTAKRIERLEGWWNKLPRTTGYVDLSAKMR